MVKPSKAAKTLSYRQAASLRLAQLYRVAAVMREAGEILNAGPWLKVLANILSSAPSGPLGKRRGRHAPDLWELSYHTLLIAARRCGLEANADEIEEQVFETQAWRHRESERIGRPHYAPMRPDKIGELLGITEIVRREAQAWTVGVLGGSRKARAEARKEQHRLHDELKRREAGARPQSQSLSRIKPWEAEGISRRTWYRRRAEADPDGSPDEGAPAEMAQLPEAQLPEQQISERGTTSCAANIPHRLRLREFAKDDASAQAERLQATTGAGAEGGGQKRKTAEADTMQAAIESWRLIKGQPTPPYQTQPGGIAARALVDAMEMRGQP